MIDSIRHDGIVFGPLDAWASQMGDLSSSLILDKQRHPAHHRSVSTQQPGKSHIANRGAREKLEKIGDFYYKSHIYELRDTVTEASPILSLPPRLNTKTIHEEGTDALRTCSNCSVRVIIAP